MNTLKCDSYLIYIVSLQEQDQLPGGEYCVKNTGNTCTAIWPEFIDEQRGEADCMCSCSLSRCGGCVDGDYSVYTKSILDQYFICWSNLTHEMNRTAVFITEEESRYRNDEIPTENFRYIEANFIIVAGKLYLLCMYINRMS